MSDNEQMNEKVDDVLAEMLERADAMQTHGTTHGVRLAIREFVRRIKTARKREREEVEADALAVGGIVEAARTAAKSSAVGNADPKFDLCRDVEKVLKIGRDFQKQDPWRGAQHDTAKLLCDTIEYLSERLSAQVGNAAAMREALEEIRVEAMSDYEPDADYLIEKCNAALSEPARNCDRPECATSKDAQNVWRKEDGGKTPYYEWLLAPAAERKGDGDGR